MNINFNDRLSVEIENHRMRAIMAENQDCHTEAKDEWYIHDCLKALKEIHESGSCNECKFSKECKVCPTVGSLVRYNCAFFIRKQEEKLKFGDE